jgi:hypothetical protein
LEIDTGVVIKVFLHEGESTLLVLSSLVADFPADNKAVRRRTSVAGDLTGVLASDLSTPVRGGVLHVFDAARTGLLVPAEVNAVVGNLDSGTGIPLAFLARIAFSQLSTGI